MTDEIPEGERKERLTITIDESILKKIIEISDGSKRKVSTIINFILRTSVNLDKLHSKYSKEGGIEK